MPTMIREKGKAKKIAYNILGVPPNIQNAKPLSEIKRERAKHVPIGQRTK